MSERESMAERIKRALENGSGEAAKESLAALKSPGSQSQPDDPETHIVRPTPAKGASGTCLLLDVSGSMSEECEPGRSKWHALRDLTGQFLFHRMIAFSDKPEECRPSTLPLPRGGTNMALAFRFLHKERIAHAVLITDGLPDDEQAALDAARGLRLDIFYVGPGTRPAFLDRLARATGGTSQTASLAQLRSRRLALSVRSMLALPAGGKAAE